MIDSQREALIVELRETARQLSVLGQRLEGMVVNLEEDEETQTA